MRSLPCASLQPGALNFATAILLVSSLQAGPALAAAATASSTPAADARRSAPRTAAAVHRGETPDDAPALAKARRTSPAARPQAGPFTSVQVNVDALGANILADAANEPSIAVDPLHPNRIAIGWRQFDSIVSNFRQAGFAWSDDSGRSWQTGVLTRGIFRSDPVLSFDANGLFYYSSLEASGGSLTTDLFVSGDGGATWSGPFYSSGGDKQWIQVDRTGGIGKGHIYQSWSTAAGCCGNNTFNRSTNGGLSFWAPTAIPSTPIWGTLDVAADGALWVAGVDPNNLGRFLVARSQSAKDKTVDPLFDFSRTVNMGGSIAVQLGPGSPNPAGLVGQVWMAIDPTTGPRAGWIYMVCSVAPLDADPLDVHFVRSTDGGMTWSDPIRINDDATTGWQWLATMSVAPTGRLDVVWNDTRDSGLPNLSALYYASSADGGTTWTPNQKLSPQWDSHTGWPNQEKIGDYYHMISDAVGAHLAWAATFNSEQDVYYLRIGDYDCNANGVGDSLDVAMQTSPDSNSNGIPDECEGITGIGDRDCNANGVADEQDIARHNSTDANENGVPDECEEIGAPASRAFALLQNSPNPFNPRTRISFDVPPDMNHVTLRVFDARGRLVRTLLDRGDVVPGRNHVWWDGVDAGGVPVASGLYVYRLEARGFSAVRRMVLLR